MMENENSRNVEGHRAITINVAARTVGIFFGFVFQVLVVKILVPSQFAIYALALAAIAIGGQLLSFGANEPLLRYVPCCMARGDVHGLKLLAKRIITLRATSLFILA